MTLDRLQCPKRTKKKPLCGGALQLDTRLKSGHASLKPKPHEIEFGTLRCQACHAKYPILAGVALLVNDVQSYLCHHAKGIGHLVPDKEIPVEYRREFLAAKRQAQLEQTHIEEDLEAQRVNALYVMNHYLRTDSSLHARNNEGSAPETPWWQPPTGSGSPVFDILIRQHWDHGVFATIGTWLKAYPPGDLVELGCGVGGLASVLKKNLRSYLGTDSSFASIALSRHVNLGTPYRAKIEIPGDLLAGPVSRPTLLPVASSFDGTTDFVVSEFANNALRNNQFDIAVALNAIDMLDHPMDLPSLKHGLLKAAGVAIQSGPYIWHEAVAKKLRARLPKTVTNSAGAVEWLYQQTGFTVDQRIEHLPWLFFKHYRQLEIYSVHVFLARKNK